MPCVQIDIGEDLTAVVCGVPRRNTCFYCGAFGEFLCDFPTGKKRLGLRKTCDRSLCRKCAQKGVSGNVDFCRHHYPTARAAYERRIEKAA